MILVSWVEVDDILVGKLTSQMVKESLYALEDILLWAIFHSHVSTSKENCQKLLIGGQWWVIDVRWIYKKGWSTYNPETIRLLKNKSPGKQKIDFSDRKWKLWCQICWLNLLDLDWATWINLPFSSVFSDLCCMYFRWSACPSVRLF